jgi:hypothetical protein
MAQRLDWSIVSCRVQTDALIDLGPAIRISPEKRRGSWAPLGRAVGVALNARGYPARVDITDNRRAFTSMWF